jgi:CheY-like chemotaxis protein
MNRNMIETTVTELQEPHIFHRSIKDYGNHDDVESALRASIRAYNDARRQQDRSQSQRDVFWHNRSHYDESEPSEPQEVKREMRRLSALESFQILEDFPEGNAPSCDARHSGPNSSLLDQATSEKANLSSHIALAPEPTADLATTLSALNHLVGLATTMFNVPVALITVADLGQQLILAEKGIGSVNLPLVLPRLEFSPCAHIVLMKDNELLVVPDLRADVQFTPYDLSSIPEGLQGGRFYAGAPLVSPEGEPIGAFCVVDTVPRPDGLNELQRQALQQLAELAMHALVERRSRLQLTRRLQHANRANAATIHDLLTPVTAVELAVSLLHEDQDFQTKLSRHQKESVRIASNCVGIMARMCRGLRDQHNDSCSTHPRPNDANTLGVASSGCLQPGNPDFGLSADSFCIMYGSGGCTDDLLICSSDPMCPAAPGATVVVQELLNSILMAVDAINTTNPIVLELHASVPSSIITDDVKVLRCAMNLLEHSASLATASSGPIRLSIRPQHCLCGKAMLGFCCTRYGDTNPACADDQCIVECCNIKADQNAAMATAGSTSSSSTESALGQLDCCHRPGAMEQQSLRRFTEVNLHSIAMQMDALGGDCGIDDAKSGHQSVVESNSEETRGRVWFRIPLVVPQTNCGEPVRPTTLSTTGTPLASYEDCTHLPNPSASSHNQRESFHQIDSTHRSSHEIAEANFILEAHPRRRRALIIEDSIVIRKVVANALSKIGFEAETAVNGMEGLHCLQNNMYDVVLCDFLMPVMDGLDCVMQYRQWEKIHRPFLRQFIIGMSAHASDKDVQRGLMVGMDLYKEKPLSYKGLKNLVDACGKNQPQNRYIVSNTLSSVDHSHAEANAKRDECQSRSDRSRHYRRDQPKMCLIAAKDAGASHDLARLTEAKGWRSLMVQCGEDALEALKKRNWDAVFLDESLPLLSGKNCAAAFREWERENRINQQRHLFILVGKENSSKVPAANGVLRKPVQPRDFEAILKSAEVPTLAIVMR